MSNFGIELSRIVAEGTHLKCAPLGIANAEKNKPHFKKNILDLVGVDDDPDKPAIVVVGGPSLHRKNTAVRIREGDFKGTLITADGSFGYCLRNGLIPDYVICLDMNPTRIVRWFGDPDLETRPDDDYFRRQDFDPAFWEDEKRHNRELIELVNRYGHKIKAVLCSSVDPSVTKRCVDSGMDIYWWHPTHDDPDQPESITRKLIEETGIPCMMTGGNVGTSAWIFAWAVLQRKHVAVTGMDFGYAPGTPFLNTQYFYELREEFGEEKAAEAYIKIINPYLNEEWYTDPTFYWFRDVFLNLAHTQATCTTYNCTEGGTLFGDGINFMPLSEFLSRFSNKGGHGG